MNRDTDRTECVAFRLGLRGRWGAEPSTGAVAHGNAGLPKRNPELVHHRLQGGAAAFVTA